MSQKEKDEMRQWEATTDGESIRRTHSELMKPIRSSFKDSFVIVRVLVSYCVGVCEHPW